jgi:NAD(P)-dependent dehydrogenase (short-subunit alcohol dehydrogenase family)
VIDARGVNNLARQVTEEFGRLDILVNNAAIHYDTWQTASKADIEGIVRESFETNVFRAWRMIEAFVPLMQRHRGGRIVNVSRGAGSLTSMGVGTPAYSTSKAALNALTKVVADELRTNGILVNAVCPLSLLKIRSERKLGHARERKIVRLVARGSSCDQSRSLLPAESAGRFRSGNAWTKWHRSLRRHQRRVRGVTPRGAGSDGAYHRLEGW